MGESQASDLESISKKHGGLFSWACKLWRRLCPEKHFKCIMGGRVGKEYRKIDLQSSISEAKTKKHYDCNNVFQNLMILEQMLGYDPQVDQIQYICDRLQHVLPSLILGGQFPDFYFSTYFYLLTPPNLIKSSRFLSAAPPPKSN